MHLLQNISNITHEKWAQRSPSTVREHQCMGSTSQRNQLKFCAHTAVGTTVTKFAPLANISRVLGARLSLISYYRFYTCAQKMSGSCKLALVA